MRKCPNCKRIMAPRELIHESPDDTGIAVYFCGTCETRYKIQVDLPLEKLFLLAGSIVEYTEFLLKHGLEKKDCAYLTKASQLEGVKFVLMRYGTWSSKPENININEAAEQRVRSQERW
jgi:hypothetical protein